MFEEKYGLSAYSQVIHRNKYARFNYDENRRETWEESVKRYISFFQERFKDLKLPKDIFTKLEKSILYLHVMPSMRALMTAGKALDRDNICGFNCAYLPIDNPVAFSEIMYLSMNGTGVGFSCESTYTRQLPEVPEEFHTTDTVIKVADSKLGWASSYKQLITLLYAGYVPKWDVSKVRPAGSPLKTFGGQASGSEPLVELFNFTVRTFQNAKGRKLRSIECHDLACMIGNIVVAGGVRRSALISLSDLGDETLRTAKSGNWYDHAKWRRLANNSAVYEERPDLITFMRELSSLYESKSGERGIFSRYGADKHIELNGRRETGYEWGCNPSLRGGTKVLTNTGIFEIQDLSESEFYITNLNGQISKAKCFLSGKDKPLYKITLEGGHEYYCTEEHKWPIYKDKKSSTYTKLKTSDICSGSYLPITRKSSLYNSSNGTRDEGFLIGWNLGDGWQTIRADDGSRQIGFVVSEQDNCENRVTDKIIEVLRGLGSSCNFDKRGELNVNHSNLKNLFDRFGVQHKTKGLPTGVWDNSSDEFRAGLLDGLFSSDGCFSDRGSIESSNYCFIKEVSELLGFYGIKNYIRGGKLKRNPTFPNGKEYDRDYFNYRLTISKPYLSHFINVVGYLTNVKKDESLRKLLGSSNRKLYDKIQILSVEKTDLREDVWDISVYDDIHCFNLSHCVTGNCGEIILRPNEFCNLSEVICRPEDTIDTLMDKIELATIIGTFQSTLTDYKFISKKWQKNSEEERLLGVSLTGIFDNPLMMNVDWRRENLEGLKQHAINVNEKWAAKLGINPSVAITTIKPSGTVSQLVNSSSGIHPRYAPYYIRSIRIGKSDPLSEFLIESGVKHEPDMFESDRTNVFYFPIKSPSTSVMVNQVGAIEHLNIWKDFKTMYTEHNPSVSIYVKEDEWLSVGDWVYKNFDDAVGIAFFPYDDSVYQQPVYAPCTENEYNELNDKTPSTFDWNLLSEIGDNTTSSQELACQGGACEL